MGWDETDVTKAMSGITTDNGLTWKHIANVSPGTGGKIAMAADDPKKMVWAPHNAGPVYTVDGGATWNPAMANGAPLPASWQLSNPWWNGDVLAADQVAPGTYYYFNNGDFYASKDGGATWTNNYVAWPQDPHWVIAVSIEPNPAKAGDVWMAFAPNPNQTSAYQLIHSTDGGKTFAPVTTLQYANFVAFGKGNDAITPFIYVHGRAPGDAADAIYKSEDTGATWIRISDPNRMQFGEINSLEGDMRTKDLVYVGQGGRNRVRLRSRLRHRAGEPHQPVSHSHSASDAPHQVAPSPTIRLPTAYRPASRNAPDRSVSSVSHSYVENVE